MADETMPRRDFLIGAAAGTVAASAAATAAPARAQTAPLPATPASRAADLVLKSAR